MPTPVMLAKIPETRFALSMMPFTTSKAMLAVVAKLAVEESREKSAVVVVSVVVAKFAVVEVRAVVAKLAVLEVKAEMAKLAVVEVREVGAE